jgi:hypothetical protein
MKKVILVLISLFSIFISSCSKINSPVSNNETKTPTGDCTIVGVNIDFVDSCSYNFVIPFLSGFDSITIVETFLGSDFYIYADSGDYDSWKEYFKNDPTIKYFFRINADSDSLLFVFVLTGQKSLEEERERFEQIEHLEIIKIEEHHKLVSINVPENTESKWAAFFKLHDFVSETYVVAVCAD